MRQARSSGNSLIFHTEVCVRAQYFAYPIGLLSIAVALAGCPEPEDRAPIGEPCDRDTPCDDLCLLDLPSGMCSTDCSDDECAEGYVCGEISDGEYCLAACEDDDGCRDGMVCVLGACRTAMETGAACEEDGDCQGAVCFAEMCTTTCDGVGQCSEGEGCLTVEGRRICTALDSAACRGKADCPAGLECIDDGRGDTYCVEYTAPESGAGTSGESCSFADCAGGYECMSRTRDPSDDPYAYCSHECGSDLDCPADMSCRQTQLSFEDSPTDRCVLREFCESCGYDSQCGSADNLCLSGSEERGAGRYCSRECDIELPVSTCPTDSSCHEALYCAADRAWVSNCEQCSDPESCGSAEGGARHQCFSDWGACAGSGGDDDYCAPCHVDSDCPT